MTRETSKSVARLAARFLSGELKTLTRKQQLSVCASCVAQAERERESIKAWGVENVDTGKLVWGAYVSKAVATHCFHKNTERVVRVLITRVRRADKRTQAGKRK